MPQQPGADRRVQRTRSLLHNALASLVHEKPYDEIVVKEILGRANVGRSTFYAHYRDKDELLERGIREMLHTGSATRAAGSPDALLGFSLPFLQQIERSRRGDELPFGAGANAIVHDHLRRVLERLLTDELRSVARPGEVVSPDLLARHVATTFVLCLEWWLQHPTLSARDVDVRFRALVIPTLESMLLSR